MRCGVKQAMDGQCAKGNSQCNTVTVHQQTRENSTVKMRFPSYKVSQGMWRSSRNCARSNLQDSHTVLLTGQHAFCHLYGDNIILAIKHTNFPSVLWDCCTRKSRSSLLALAHPGGPGKRAIKRMWWWCFETAGWVTGWAQNVIHGQFANSPICQLADSEDNLENC